MDSHSKIKETQREAGEGVGSLYSDLAVQRAKLSLLLNDVTDNHQRVEIILSLAIIDELSLQIVAASEKLLAKGISSVIPV